MPGKSDSIEVAKGMVVHGLFEDESRPRCEVEGEDEKPKGRFRSKRSNDSYKPAVKWSENWKDPVPEEDGHSIDSLVGDRGGEVLFYNWMSALYA